VPEALTRSYAHAGALELRELRYFAAAARTGNLGSAARELFVTPPAISQQIRKLEDGLGTQLLIRHSRGVTPTPAGACLLERIETSLRTLDAPLDPERVDAGMGSAITVAVSAEIGTFLAAPLVAEVRRRWPEVTLELTETTGAGNEARLLGGQADIAVLAEPADLDELLIDRLLTEGLGLVASPRDKLAKDALPLRLRDLARVRLILPAPRHWLRRLLARAGFQRGVRFDAVLQVDSVSMTKAMVRDGLGCTILPASAVRDELARGALVFRALEQPALAATYATACRRGSSPVVHDIAQAMGDLIRSLVASGTWPGALPCRPPAPLDSVEPEPGLPPEAWRLPQVEPIRGEVEFMEGD
jgi:LysR family nitrogen assimilation transcriptional regulator